MKQSKLALSLAAAAFIAPNGCSARGLRRQGIMRRQKFGNGILSRSPVETENNEEKNMLAEVEDADFRAFFDGVLTQISSFDSAAPSAVPTSSPSETPTSSPSSSPSAPPSEMGATPSPTESPSVAPSDGPTAVPSSGPTATPSSTPTISPSLTPTESPSATPSTPVPTDAPTPGGPCDLQPTGRETLINIFLRVISNPADVDTPGSPQQLALDWMVNTDPMQVCPQDQNLIQRYVMAVFYFSTRGNRWTECSSPPLTTDFNSPEALAAEAAANAACTLQVAGVNASSNAWLTGGSECEWGGLGCDADNFVTRIEFEQNGIAGTLPYELERLQSLTNLILEEGILTGTIPSRLGQIRSLEQIDLNFNLLQGPIPEELYGLSNLRVMDLNDNELTGTISSSISDLTQMSFFQIENNGFTGTVPTTFGQLTSLEVATLDNNQLSGTMPCAEFAQTFSFPRVLTSDCLGAPNRPSPPLVICECCTTCF